MSDCSGKNGGSRSRDEVISTFSRYGLLSGEGIIQMGESEEIQRLEWFLSNGRIESFELPDAYVKVDDQILIIEHFAIDGFETYPNGGSKLQRHEAMTEREFRDMPATETGGHTTTKIGVSNSYTGFIKNCQAKFDHHYSRIPCYKEHLLACGTASEDTRFTVCFLMDEVSPMGTLTHDGEKLRPVCLAHSKEFLEYFLTRPDVDWIISAIVRIPESGYYPYFFSQQDIDYCLKHTLDYANYQFLPSESTVETRLKVVIPKED